MGGGECREEPPDLPLLELREWVLKHPPTSYFPGAEDEPIGIDGIAVSVTSVALHVVGEVIERSILGWVGFLMDAFHSLAEEAELEELPEKRREAQLEAWRAYMRETFWADESRYPSSEAREKAFDALVGDNAGHGVVPTLSTEAEAQRQELIDQINGRWLEKIEAINDHTQRLERLAADTPEHAAERARNQEYAEHLRAEAAEERRLAATPGAQEWVPYGTGDGYYRAVDPQRSLERAEKLEKYATDTEQQVDRRIHDVEGDVESEKAALMDDMKKDVQSVAAFDSDPSHWDLTPEQKAMLACDAPAPKPAETPHHSRHRGRPA